MDWNAYKCRISFIKESHAKLDSSPFPILKAPSNFSEITQSRAARLFNYDPLTGKLTDKQGNNVVFYSSIKFGSKKTHYVRLGLTKISAARVIWLLVHGKHKTSVYLKDPKKGLILDNLFIKE